MFYHYVLAYLQEDPRLTPDVLARGITLFANVKEELSYLKDYPLLSDALRCIRSPLRYPDVVLASKGVLYPVVAMDYIKAWMYNHVITRDVANIALSTFYTLIISDRKYHRLDSKWFAEVCVALAEKIEKASRVEGEYWSVYLDLTKYTELLRSSTHQPVFLTNVLRYLPSLVPAESDGPSLILKQSLPPAELEEVPDVKLGMRHASGSYGGVYIIESDRGDKLAVKKQIMNEMTSQELTVMTTCNHPNIISLHSFKLEGRTAQLFMPYGEVLSTYTAKVLNKEDWEYVYVQGNTKVQLPRDLRRRYARDILKGLHYLHENGIIHGDVKPTNVVIIDGVAKLIDFGLSFLYTFSKFDQQLKPLNVYSLPYQPPEISFLQNATYSYPADVWAAGVLLLELETGVLPTIYGRLEILSDEETLWKTTSEVIGGPFEIEPYENFPYPNADIRGLAAVHDMKFRELVLSMLEWIPGDRATIPNLLSTLERN